jgi:hypothetical protein
MQRYGEDRHTVSVDETGHLIDLTRFLRYALQVFLHAGRAMYNASGDTP